VNPLSVVPLLVYTLAATLWPAQVDSRRRGASLLLVEAVIVAAAVVAGGYLAELVVPRSQGLWWGRVGLLATGYLYVCGRGMSVIRAVLELPTLQMRRDDDRTAGAIDIARGRAIGALERALTLWSYWANTQRSAGSSPPSHSPASKRWRTVSSLSTS